jgi:hypothetical protein
MASYVFESLKGAAAYGCSTLGNQCFYGPTIYLATAPLTLGHELNQEVIRNCFAKLTDPQKGQVYGKVWELAKMQDPRIKGDKWGQENVFKDDTRLANALQRLGFLNYGKSHAVSMLSSAFGEGGIGSQYFSLGEKLGRDPQKGQISCVNGMGVPSLGHAGKDAARLSHGLLDGYNVHCVYHATHQKTPNGDLLGFAADVVRMKAIEGGSYSKTSYLIAQQWVDFLTAHTDQYFLQIAHSEGTAHVDAALRLLTDAKLDALFSRIRVMNFCPAHFLDPSIYSPHLQARNFVKKEDSVINPWGTGATQINAHPPYVVVVPHKGDHPHNHVSKDYMDAARPCVDAFFRSGNIY